MAGRTRRTSQSILLPREQAAWRRAYALAAGVNTPEPSRFPPQAETPQLGPYEVQYNVQHGYTVDRDIIRP